MLNDLPVRKVCRAPRFLSSVCIWLKQLDDKLKNVMMTILYKGITQKYLVKMMILFNI